MEFKHPLFFILFFLSPLILISKDGLPLFFKNWSKEKKSGITFSSLNILKTIPQSAIIQERFLIVNFLRMITFAFFVVALARPQSSKQLLETEVSGRDVILALDVSGSMNALDFQINGERTNRLKALKKVVSEFIDQRKGDRIGIVIFGEDVFTQCPLTLDHGVVKDFINSLEVGMLGDGTSLGDGIALAVKKLKSIKENSKVIILVTDGVKTSGSVEPIQAAELAEKENIKIYTIGIGSDKPAPFAVPGIFGGSSIQYQNVILDEKGLKEIADKTKAKFFNAQNTKELEQIYQEISNLEERRTIVNDFKEYEENFFIFLLIGAILFFLLEVLERLRYRAIP